MAGTKRSSDDASPTTRSAKVAKKNGGTSVPSKGKGAKKGAKTNIATSAFMAKALPISANFTNTPPSVADDESVPAASADPGFIGGVKCLPSQFSTGSYGWKGNRRVSIEVRNEAGEMEKVSVQVTINATVVGSKNAPEEAAHEKPEEKVDEEKAEGEKGGEEKAAEEVVVEEKAE
ncbi:hypothetical protein PILCRDRAFT_814969 [Piloderma croceum F 1598]|uniref:Uncharacterized protein n=1 Tax=Piloderma croceum (strain F 1598) TaxID=765440 RepID=A0A0C3G9Z7_PILCF|nr:hypothetical protein PILCRDRAFT_814969 [Piloderma croceum F 1598]